MSRADYRTAAMRTCAVILANPGAAADVPVARRSRMPEIGERLWLRSAWERANRL